MCFARVDRYNANASQNIHSVSDRFQVGWIDTGAVPAFVVNVISIWHGSLKMTVCPNVSVVILKAPITID